MSFIKVTGIKNVQAKILGGKSSGVQAMKAALVKEAEQMMALSKPLVPVVTGTLRASGHVQLPMQAFGTVLVELGYGGAAAPYAANVHENPRAGKTGGVSPRGAPYSRTQGGKPTWSTHSNGQWKYLEQPFNKQVPGMRARIGKFISARLRLGVS